MTTRTVKHVTRDQVSAARALIELRGGIENVDALTAKIGTATPRSSLILQFDERAVVQPTNEPVAHRARLRADGLGDYLVGMLAGSEALDGAVRVRQPGDPREYPPDTTAKPWLTYPREVRKRRNCRTGA